MEGGGGIERLADDLLSLIASHLSLEEAARACVLSSRWDKLWNAIPCLSFVSPRYPDDINDCSKYVQKVKRVLERRGGALPPAAAFTLNSLEFGHLLDRTHWQLVEDWFCYAMAHKVENLILDLWIDDPVEALETPPAAALTNLKWLKTLKLKRVNLTKEFVELVLSNCRLLEKLVVVPNEQLPGLRISGSSLLLRHLKIGGYSFDEFELISLCAPNLTSFNYFGPRLILGTLDVPGCSACPSAAELKLCTDL
uniref:At1g61320/AtMIF1 LRR domain-containing protein n=1 Tax=Kalanchoe fedtschenkoi TaxID=63787 RepID=A0A7N0SY35_KALFE